MLYKHFVTHVLTRFFRTRTNVRIRPFKNARRGEPRTFYQRFIHRPSSRPPTSTPTPRELNHLPTNRMNLAINGNVNPSNTNGHLPLPRHPSTNPTPTTLNTRLKMGIVPPNEPNQGGHLYRQTNQEIPIGNRQNPRHFINL